MKAIYSFVLALALSLYFSSFANTTGEERSDDKQTKQMFGMPLR